MRPVLVVVAALAGCGGEERAAKPAGPEPVAKTPERDCSVLTAAIDRITANEVDAIRKTRPRDVAPVAERELSDVSAILRTVMPKLCEEDRWSGAYTACMTGAKLRDDARACQAHLSAAQVAHLATDVGAAPPPEQDLPPECNEYVAVTERFMQCNTVPQASRDAIRQALVQVTDGFRQAASNPTARQAMGEGCKQAIDAIKQAGAVMGCAL